MTPNCPAKIGPYFCGKEQPLMLIAGPCVLQRESSKAVAFKLREIVEELAQEGAKINLVFKGSFDKANRTSVGSWRGLGLDEGLKLLSEIKTETELPVTTDIHETTQAAPTAEVVDLLQIPAFLARQTDLIAAAAKTRKPIHVKKGQFMAPEDMKRVVDKALAFGCKDVLLGERGTFFGYGNLVNDFRSLVIMRGFGVPVVFDATHSVQRPSAGDGVSGGKREFVPPLARAAAAVGIDALFLETIFNPEESPSDGPNMLPLDQVKGLLRTVVNIRRAADLGA